MTVYNNFNNTHIDDWGFFIELETGKPVYNGFDVFNNNNYINNQLLNTTTFDKKKELTYQNLSFCLTILFKSIDFIVDIMKLIKNN